jgi:solute carrier family 35 protein F5
MERALRSPQQKTSLIREKQCVSAPSSVSSGSSCVSLTLVSGGPPLTSYAQANYFNSYCLKFTSVASATILSSTSSMFTLIIGTLLRIERFSLTKLFSVLVSLMGIILISTTDLSPSSSAEDLPTRSPFQVLLGDAMALLSALAYATYITLLKVRAGDESRVNMQLFFGFVGLFNLIFLWPGLLILHRTGIEPFEMPPERRVWEILLLNASITLTSDFCWAYAMLLTTPLVVTVGLSLTIPLALMGQMVVLGSIAGGWYWVGAACVFVAFWFLNKEEERTG